MPVRVFLGLGNVLRTCGICDGEQKRNNQLSHGRQKAAESECAPILRILSHGTPPCCDGFPVLRSSFRWSNRCSSGVAWTATVSHLGPSYWVHGAPGRCIPSYADTYALIIIDKSLSSWLMMHLSSLAAPKEPRSRSEMRRSSAPCCRVSCHSHKVSGLLKADQVLRCVSISLRSLSHFFPDQRAPFSGYRARRRPRGPPA